MTQNAPNDFNVKIITTFLRMGLKGHPLTNLTRRGFDPALHQ